MLDGTAHAVNGSGANPVTRSDLGAPGYVAASVMVSCRQQHLDREAWLLIATLIRVAAAIVRALGRAPARISRGVVRTHWLFSLHGFRGY
jgi:hypothetical protein